MSEDKLGELFQNELRDWYDSFIEKEEKEPETTASKAFEVRSDKLGDYICESDKQNKETPTGGTQPNLVEMFRVLGEAAKAVLFKSQATPKKDPKPVEPDVAVAASAAETHQSGSLNLPPGTRMIETTEKSPETLALLQKILKEPACVVGPASTSLLRKLKTKFVVVKKCPTDDLIYDFHLFCGSEEIDADFWIKFGEKGAISMPKRIEDAFPLCACPYENVSILVFAEAPRHLSECHVEYKKGLLSSAAKKMFLATGATPYNCDDGYIMNGEFHAQEKKITPEEYAIEMQNRVGDCLSQFPLKVTSDSVTTLTSHVLAYKRCGMPQDYSKWSIFAYNAMNLLSRMEATPKVSMAVLFELGKMADFIEFE